MNPERRPITVEDLLRLKRAERPADSFWQQFDRELRAKQLAALVTKRPWWQRLPRFSPRLAQYRFPLGAAAAVAVTFVSVRNYSGDISVPDSASNPVAHTSSEVAFPGSGGTHAFNPANSSGATFAAASGEFSPAFSEAALSSTASADAAVAAESRVNSDATIALELSRIVPLFGGTAAPQESELSPSARNIAANLQVAELHESLGGGLLTGSSGRGFESRALPARAAMVDPLQQMTPPGEHRRARYLTAMISTPADESLDRTTARMAHRISGDELYEQVQRFGTRRGGFNVKF